MATHRLTDIHRTALALLQANRAGDRAAVESVLAMLAEDDVVDFLEALANIANFALASDPRNGWQAFVDSYAASMDQVEATLDGKTDT
jgi:hypothetical protein